MNSTYPVYNYGIYDLIDLYQGRCSYSVPYRQAVLDKLNRLIDLDYVVLAVF